MLSPTNGFPVVPQKGNSASPVSESFADFIRRQALKRNTKKLADMLGVSTRTVKKMRSDADIDTRAKVVTRWCQHDPEFRSDYFRHCGGHIETDPGLVKGVSAAITAVMAYRANEAQQ